MTVRACSSVSTTPAFVFDKFHECFGPVTDLVVIHKHPSVAELCVSYAKQFNLLWIAAFLAKLLHEWMFAHCLYVGDHGLHMFKCIII